MKMETTVRLGFQKALLATLCLCLVVLISPLSPMPSYAADIAAASAAGAEQAENADGGQGQAATQNTSAQVEVQTQGAEPEQVAETVSNEADNTDAQPAADSEKGRAQASSVKADMSSAAGPNANGEGEADDADKGEADAKADAKANATNNENKEKVADGPYAIGDKKYAALQEALDALAGKSGTIKVEKDATESGAITVPAGADVAFEFAAGKSLTINGNVIV